MARKKKNATEPEAERTQEPQPDAVCGHPVHALLEPLPIVDGRTEGEKAEDGDSEEEDGDLIDEDPSDDEDDEDEDEAEPQPPPAEPAKPTIVAGVAIVDPPPAAWPSLPIQAIVDQPPAAPLPTQAVAPSTAKPSPPTEAELRERLADLDEFAQELREKISRSSQKLAEVEQNRIGVLSEMTKRARAVVRKRPTNPFFA